MMGLRMMVAGLAALAVIGGGLAPRAAQADSGDFVGGVITGVIGSAIVGNMQKNRARQSTPGPRSYYNATVRDTQLALNYFGFPAGPADGVRGAKTRRAASLFQAYMGYPVTGRLTEGERAFLYASHQRALAEEPRTSQLAASLADGRKGLLKHYQGQPAGGSFAGLPPSVSEAVHEIAANAEPTAEQLVQTAGFVQMADLNNDGRNDYILDTSVTGSGFWCQQQRCAVRVFASTPQGYVRNDFLVSEARPANFTCQAGSCALTAVSAPEAEAEPAPAPAPAPKMATAPSGGGELPNLLGGGAAEQTLAAHCDAVGAGPSSGSAGRVIDEQFCFARAVAISDGDRLVKRVQGLSYDQVAAQCRALSGAMAAHVARLGDAGPDDVLGGVRDLVAGSGTPPAQLAGTARICLGIGYAEDDSEMALASALLAVATGAPAYGELVGHHLTKGFGVIPRRDLARAWYRASFDAIEAGAERVFAPDQPGRIALLRAAVLGEGAADADGALPVFSVAQ